MTNKIIYEALVLGLILSPAVAGAQYYNNQYQSQNNYPYPYNNYGNYGMYTYGGNVLGTSYMPPSLGCNFAHNLSLGTYGTDVADLNRMLGVGDGSYFSNATYNAVVRFQNQYAGEVLYPAGLTYGTGYVGAMTRAKLNLFCNGGSGFVQYGSVLGVTYNPYSYPYPYPYPYNNYNYQYQQNSYLTPTVNFYASPTSVYSGGSVTLYWTTTNASICSASGNWSGSKVTSGNEVVYPGSSTRTYILICTNTNNQTTSQTITVG